MSLFDSSQIYTSEVNIPIRMCPSSTEAMNKVKNMLQIHTTNGPVILHPYQQEILNKASTGILKIITLTGCITRELAYLMDESIHKVREDYLI